MRGQRRLVRWDDGWTTLKTSCVVGLAAGMFVAVQRQATGDVKPAHASNDAGEVPPRSRDESAAI